MSLAPLVLVLVAGLGFGIPEPHSGDKGVRPGKPRIVRLSAGTVLDEHSAPLISSDGAFGFVSSASSGSLIVFSLATGRVLSSTRFGEVAGLPSIAETGSRRIVALPTTTYVGRRGSAVVHLLDASTPTNITRISDVALPAGAQIAPSSASPITSNGRFGVIATGPGQPKLLSFSVESGKIISEIALPGWATAIALSPLANGEASSECCIAVISTSANTLSLFTLDQTGRLTAKSRFVPDDAHFDVTDSPAFSTDGRRLYFAATKGERLFSLSVEDGSVVDTIKLRSAPRRVTVATSITGTELIGVTHVNAVATLPAGVSILESRSGRLTMKSEATLPEGTGLSPASGLAFDNERSLAFIGTLGGALIGFDIETGAPAIVQSVGGELRNFAQLRGTLVGVRSSSTADEIAVVPLIENPDESDTTGAPSTLPEITGVSGDGEYLRLVIDGSNFSKDAAVELVRAGRVLSRRSPILVTGNRIVVLIPTREIETIGRFDIRVTDAGAGISNAVGADAQTLLSPARAVPIQNEVPSRQSMRNEVAGSAEVQPVESNDSGPAIFASAASRSRRITSQSGGGSGSGYPKAYDPADDEKTHISDEIPVRPRRVEPQAVSMTRHTTTEEMLQITGKSRLVTPEIVNGSLCFVVHTATARYKPFTLENPSRIVLDVDHQKGEAKSETIALGTGPVERVRVGQPRRGIFRVVLDLREPVSYTITRDANSLILTIGPAENARLKRP
jgi:hypothetical protein